MKSATFLLAAISTVLSVALQGSAAIVQVTEPPIDNAVRAAVMRDVAAIRQPIVQHRRELMKRGGGGGGSPPASCPKACIDGNNCRVGCTTLVFTMANFSTGSPMQYKWYMPEHVRHVANGISCSAPDGCNIQITNSNSASVDWSVTSTAEVDTGAVKVSFSATYGQSTTTAHAQTATIGFVPFMTSTYGWMNYFNVTNTNGDGVTVNSMIWSHIDAPMAAPDGTAQGDFVVCLGGWYEGCTCKCIGGCSNLLSHDLPPPTISTNNTSAGASTTPALVIAKETQTPASVISTARTPSSTAPSVATFTSARTSAVAPSTVDIGGKGAYPPASTTLPPASTQLCLCGPNQRADWFLASNH